MSDGADESPRFGASEYLCHAVLRRADVAASYDISRTRFLALSALANRRLRDESGVGIEFPRYWYLFGEVVDEHSLDRGFFHAPRSRHWPGQHYVPADVAEPAFRVDPDVRDAIDAAARWTVETLGQRSTSSLLEYQHREYAPNRFVEATFELRTFLSNVDLDRQRTLGDFTSTDRSTLDRVVALLDELAATYPAAEYQEMEPLYRRWNRVIRQRLAGEPDFAGARGALEAFHETIAKVEWRLHHHEHLPEDRILEWEGERAGEKAAFRRRLDREFATVSRDDLAAVASLGSGTDGGFDADLATWYGEETDQ